MREVLRPGAILTGKVVRLGAAPARPVLPGVPRLLGSGKKEGGCGLGMSSVGTEKADDLLM